MGGSEVTTRAALGFGTGSRNVAAALLVGAQNFKDPRVNVMVIVSALVALLILLPAARTLGKRSPRAVVSPIANQAIHEIKRS